jgi:hypothetical protein
MEWDWIKAFLRDHVPAVWRVCHAMSAKMALWVLLSFVAIGLLQTVLAYEAGVLAVDALPSDVADARRRRRLRRFFLGLGLALFVMTAVIGFLNDATQKVAEIREQHLGDSVSILLGAAQKNEAFLESLASANLPIAKQNQLSEIEKANKKAIAIGSFALRKKAPGDADVQAPAATAPVEMPSSPQSTTISSQAATGSTDVLSSLPGVGGNTPPATDAQSKEPKPVQYVMELDSLSADSVNRQESWKFFASVNGEKGFCDIDWTVKANKETISLRDDRYASVCPVHDVPLSGEIRLYVETYASMSGKMSVINYKGYLRGGGDDIVTRDGVLLQAKGQATTAQDFTLRLTGARGLFELKGRIRQK